MLRLEREDKEDGDLPSEMAKEGMHRRGGGLGKHGESATVVGAVFENWGRGEGKNEDIVEWSTIFTNGK